MRRLFVILALLMACRSPLDIRVEQPDSPRHPAWVQDPKLSERTIAAADAAAVVWGAKPADLDGWTIVFVPEPIEVWEDGRMTTGRASQDLGDVVFGTGTIAVYDGYLDWCVETTSLAHEVGHAVGNWGHDDPRWSDGLFWQQMAFTLAGVVPYEDTLCRNLLLAGVIVR